MIGPCLRDRHVTMSTLTVTRKYVVCTISNTPELFRPDQFMLCPRVPTRCFLSRVTMRGMTGPGGFSVTGKSFARSPAPRVASRRTKLTKLSHPARTMHNGKLRGKNAMIDCPVSLSPNSSFPAHFLEINLVTYQSVIMMIKCTSILLLCCI